MKELWKDIEKFEGFHQISNLGRIKSFYKYDYKQRKHIWNEHIKVDMTKKDHQNKYIVVILRKPGFIRNVQIQVLVAEAFIPNPDNKPIAHHRNHRKCDNYAENLMWVTRSENRKYATLFYKENPELKPSNILKGKEKLNKTYFSNVDKNNKRIPVLDFECFFFNPALNDKYHCQD